MQGGEQVRVSVQSLAETVNGIIKQE